MRAIQPGEQVTISYTDLLQTLDERQHSLMLRYAFTCCCARCLDDSPTPGDWFLDAVAADGESSEWNFDRRSNRNCSASHLCGPVRH